MNSNRIAIVAKLVFDSIAITFGAMALTPAIASAVGQEWDIETFDNCLAEI